MESTPNLSIRRVDKIIVISYILTIFILTLSFIGGYYSEDTHMKDNMTYSFAKILVNNMTLSFLLFLGILSLGLVNIGLAILNGFTIGSVFSYGVNHWGIFDSLLKIVPHGIFEIPSMIISISVGFLPILLMIQMGRSKNRINVKFYIKYIFFALLAVCLLNILAALIEANISMKL
ncbi:stage II sporulation protein M [Neobacillus sp. Marseille-QA0830]